MRHGFRISPRCWPNALAQSATTLFTSGLGLIDRCVYNRAVRNTPLTSSPLFIVGHWRCGTTLLHELLAEHPDLAYPNTYECMAPHHFLLTDGVFPRLFRWLLPNQRPMDAMSIGFDSPAEDEFAITLLGRPSPYTALAFPNEADRYQDYLDLDNLDEPEREAWLDEWNWFLQRLTYRHGKRLLLKSPTHSCRIPWISQRFPDAVFVHILRDPYEVIPSTLNLWRQLHSLNCLQTPTFDKLEDEVFATFHRVYRRLQAAGEELGPDRFVEVRFEDLLADPERELRRIAPTARIGEIEAVLRSTRQYFEKRQGFRKNRPEVPQSLRDRMVQECSELRARMGYADAPPVSVSS